MTPPSKRIKIAMSKRRIGCLIAIGLLSCGGLCLAVIASWLTGLWWLVELAVAGGR